MVEGACVVMRGGATCQVSYRTIAYATQPGPYSVDALGGVQTEEPFRCAGLYDVWPYQLDPQNQLYGHTKYER
jgi:hypothetical protein